MKRAFPVCWRSQRNSCRSVGLLLLSFLLFAGCSAAKQQLSSPVADVKQVLGLSQFYAKSYTTVRSKPDSTSRALGKISANTKVTQVSQNESGWSQVKTADGKLRGWVPTSSLSAHPVKKTVAKARTREQPVQSSSVNKEEAPALESSPPSTPLSQESEKRAPAPENEKSGSGLLSPSPAVAAPIPSASPSSPERPEDRKASPDMFDSF